MSLGINIHPYFNLEKFNYYEKIAAKYGVKIGAAQGFLVGPKNPKDEMLQEEMNKAADFIEKAGINLYTHGCFMDVPWSDMPGPKNFSLYTIKRELIKCNKIGSEGLILHLGNKPPADIAEVSCKILDSMNYFMKKKDENMLTTKKDFSSYKINEEVCKTGGDDVSLDGLIHSIEDDEYIGGSDEKTSKNIKIFLENEAAVKNENRKFNYANPAEIMLIFDEIKKIEDKNGGEYMKNMGFCIDTAHLFAAGIDISGREVVEKWIRDWEDYNDNNDNNYIFRKSRRNEHLIFHLNDQFYNCGEGRDMHASLTYGQIWKEYNNVIGGTKKLDDSGLIAFLDWAEEGNITSILERRQDGAKIVYNGGEFPIGDNIEADLAFMGKIGRFSI